MPVMLMSEDYDRWLDPATGIRELKAMLKPYDPGLMSASSRCGNVRFTPKARVQAGNITSLL